MRSVLRLDSGLVLSRSWLWKAGVLYLFLRRWESILCSSLCCVYEIYCIVLCN